MAKMPPSFNLRPGRQLGPRYTVEAKLGRGSEGEVYQVREAVTGILRAAKIYYPDRDPHQRLPIRHAQKLNTLRNCHVVLQYHHSEIIAIRGRDTVALISELYEGQPLERWVARHPGRRLKPYVALHVLYNLVCGLETVHALGEYHSDVHTANILIQPRGVRFDLKLIDFYDWGKPARFKQREDILQCIHVFHDCLGGRKHYAKQPDTVRHICAGLRATLIRKRFPTMTKLRQHLESFEWITLSD